MFYMHNIPYDNISMFWALVNKLYLPASLQNNSNLIPSKRSTKKTQLIKNLKSCHVHTVKKGKMLKISNDCQKNDTYNPHDCLKNKSTHQFNITYKKLPRLQV